MSFLQLLNAFFQIHKPLDLDYHDPREHKLQHDEQGDEDNNSGAAML